MPAKGQQPASEWAAETVDHHGQGRPTPCGCTPSCPAGRLPPRRSTDIDARGGSTALAHLQRQGIDIARCCGPWWHRSPGSLRRAVPRQLRLDLAGHTGAEIARQAAPGSPACTLSGARVVQQRPASAHGIDSGRDSRTCRHRAGCHRLAAPRIRARSAARPTPRRRQPRTPCFGSAQLAGGGQQQFTAALTVWVREAALVEKLLSPW